LGSAARDSSFTKKCHDALRKAKQKSWIFLAGARIELAVCFHSVIECFRADLTRQVRALSALVASVAQLVEQLTLNQSNGLTPSDTICLDMILLAIPDGHLPAGDTIRHRKTPPNGSRYQMRYAMHRKNMRAAAWSMWTRYQMQFESGIAPLPFHAFW
jgi:hypothetical protein